MKLSHFIKIGENIVIFFQFALQEACISQIGKKKKIEAKIKNIELPVSI